VSGAPERVGAGDSREPAGDARVATGPRTVVAVTSAAPSIVTDAPFFDHAMYGILFGNAVTLAGALFQHWPALPVLWVYWGQSVAIGLVNIVRILWLTDFSTDGFTSNGRQVPANEQGKRTTAGFFAVHYGMFHAIYALFLATGKVGGGGMTGWIAATAAFNVLLFAGIHFYPVLKTHGHDLRQKKPNLGSLMFYPYLRIIPMHLTIILGTIFPLGALPLFILLKTGADVGLHAIERKLFTSGD
jgi:hypothetical protein